MGFVGRLLLVDRAVARVADFEDGGDDQHFGQAALVGGGEDHAPDAGIDGHAGQPGSQFRQLAAVVQGSQFDQRLAAVLEGGGFGRVEEGELLDVAQLEGLGLQDDRGQVAAEDFGRGKPVAGVVVFLVVEADADAGPDPPAAAGTLVGGGLGDGLNGEPLGLRSGRVAADAGCAGIDHVADAGHGERRLGHVGGNDDSPGAAGMEDPLLLRGRQPGVEREDLGPAPCPAA